MNNSSEEGVHQQNDENAAALTVIVVRPPERTEAELDALAVNEWHRTYMWQERHVPPDPLPVPLQRTVRRPTSRFGSWGSFGLHKCCLPDESLISELELACYEANDSSGAIRFLLAVEHAYPDAYEVHTRTSPLGSLLHVIAHGADNADSYISEAEFRQYAEALPTRQEHQQAERLRWNALYNRESRFLLALWLAEHDPTMVECKDAWGRTAEHVARRRNCSFELVQALRGRLREHPSPTFSVMSTCPQSWDEARARKIAIVEDASGASPEHAHTWAL